MLLLHITQRPAAVNTYSIIILEIFLGILLAIDVQQMHCKSSAVGWQ